MPKPKAKGVQASKGEGRRSVHRISSEQRETCIYYTQKCRGQLQWPLATSLLNGFQTQFLIAEFSNFIHWVFSSKPRCKFASFPCSVVSQNQVNKNPLLFFELSTRDSWIYALHFVKLICKVALASLVLFKYLKHCQLDKDKDF